jgi:hypothetical protein
MKLEVFKDILDRIRKVENVVSDLYPIIDITNITNDYNEIITILLRCYYGEEAEDWISSYLFEHLDNEPWVWDENGKEILRNDEELWSYCEELRTTKKEYDIKEPMTEEDREKLLQLMTEAFQ